MKSLNELIESFEKLPGIGHRTAERLAYAVLDSDEEYVNKFAQNLLDVKQNIKRCKNCGILCEDEVCDICKDDNRNKDILLVVSTSRDAFAFENVTHEYKYLVLNGNISLLKNITPDKLNINLLQERVKNDNIKEVILATSSTLDGETTARYISSLLKDQVKVSRLAYGLPMDSEIDYLDSITLERAIKGRNNI